MYINESVFRELFEFSQKLNTLLVIEDMVKFVTERIPKLVHLPQAIVYLKDEQKNTLRLATHHDIDFKTPTNIINTTWNISGHPIYKKVFTEKKPVQLFDVYNHPDADSSLQNHWRRLRIKSLAIFPLIAQEEAIGTLEIAETRIKKRFIDEEMNIVHLAASSIALAIRTSLFYQTMLLDAEKFRLLFEITQEINSGHDLPKILLIIVKRVTDFLSISRSGVLLVDPQKSTAYLKAGYDSRKDNPWVSDQIITLDKYPEIKYVLKEKKTLLVEDVNNNPLMEPVLGFLKDISLKTVMVIPMLYNDKIIGIYSLGEVGRCRFFTSTEIKMLETIANYTAALLMRVDHTTAAKNLF